MTRYKYNSLETCGCVKCSGGSVDCRRGGVGTERTKQAEWNVENS